MSTPTLTGKYKVRDAKLEALKHAARAFVRSIPTGVGFTAARRGLERAAAEYADAEDVVELRGEGGA
jgi:hypothetical protein